MENTISLITNEFGNIKQINNMLNVILFLKEDYEYFKSREFLEELYPLQEKCSKKHMPERNQDILIDYVGQGFNRRRQFLTEKYDVTLGAIAMLSMKYNWKKESEKWEKIVTENYLNHLKMPLLKQNRDYSWSKKDNESYFQYFCFITFMYLNMYGTYSLNQMAALLQKCGLRLVYQTLTQYSAKHKWFDRMNDYYSNKEVMYHVNNNEMLFDFDRLVMQMIKSAKQNNGDDLDERYINGIG